MAAPNFSGDGQQKTVGDLTCSLYLTSGLHGHVTIFLVLNSFLFVTAFLGNVLILIALHKESSLHPPSKLLLRNLATTDLCVCLVSQPFTVIYWMSLANEHLNIRPYAFMAQIITGYILCGHNQTSALLLFFELALVGQHGDKIKRLPMFKDKDFRGKAFLRLKLLRTHFFRDHMFL